MAEVLFELPVRSCFACGQLDDHPRYQWHGLSLHDDPVLYHYDCIPVGALDSDPVGAQIANVARVGVHGDELRAHILKTHTPGGE